MDNLRFSVGDTARSASYEPDKHRGSAVRAALFAQLRGNPRTAVMERTTPNRYSEIHAKRQEPVPFHCIITCKSFFCHWRGLESHTSHSCHIEATVCLCQLVELPEGAFYFAVDSISDFDDGYFNETQSYRASWYHASWENHDFL